MIEEESLGCIGVGVKDEGCRVDLACARVEVNRVHEICGPALWATLSFQVDARLRTGAGGTAPQTQDGSSLRLVAAVMERCANQVAVHLSDELDGNLLGANRFALAMIGATAEKFVGHGRDHAQRAAIALRLSLRK